MFLPTKDGALNGFMRPMLDLDLTQIYRLTKASLNVMDIDRAIRLYFWQSRVEVRDNLEGDARYHVTNFSSQVLRNPNPYPFSFRI